MPRLIIAATALAGLDRCRTFLEMHDPAAAERAGVIIAQRFGRLGTHPESGRCVAEDSDLRECIIPFGRSGYVALYRFEAAEDAVIILAFRHQREAGY